MFIEVLVSTAQTTSLLVMWLLARKKRYGWLVSLGNQASYIAIGVATQVWSFVGFAVVFGGVAIYGYLHWRAPKGRST